MKPDAVVLAAGLGSRLGGPKALAQLGGRPFLAWVVDALLLGGAGRVVVVTGHEAEETEALAAELGAIIAYNPSYRQGMLCSVQAGLAHLEHRGRPFFMWPVDIPLVRPATIAALWQAAQANPRPVTHPLFLGERGHPPLISGWLIGEILDWSGRGGLGGFLNQYDWRAREVPVPDRFILRDCDTPADLAGLAADLESRHRPTPAECATLLLARQGGRRGVVPHSVMVARVGLRLAAALAGAGVELDQGLVAAAGLLHDAAKGQPGHDRAGAALLEEWGWHQVAQAVAGHVRLEADPAAPLSEAEVVHLADKLVRGDQVVAMEERFQAKLAKHGHDEAGRQAVEERRAMALIIKHKLERALEGPLATVLERPAPRESELIPDDLLAASR